MVKSLHGGAEAHTVTTELYDQKLFSHGMASIKCTASYITFLCLYKYSKSISELPIFHMKQ